MKRILFLSSEFPPGPGGIATHAYPIASALAENGWDVQVLSPQDYADPVEVAAFNQAQKFNITTLPSIGVKLFQNFNRFWKITRFIFNFNPDLVMTSGSRAIWIMALLSALRNKPWVLVGHGSEFGAQKGLGAWLTRIGGNRASLVICVSRYTQKTLRDFGITKPPSNVIHNGADQTRFYPLPAQQVVEFRKKHAVSDSFMLLTVGNVSDRKGQEVVIRALPAVKEKIPNIQYWMVGLPKEQEKLKRIANSLGVSENIRFWGRVADPLLLKIYNSCDMFLMTSRQLPDGDFEGYGIAVIEAALCRKAAVVSQNSGLAEAVQDGLTGLTVPQDDPAKTAEAVRLLAQDSHLRHELSSNAYKNALQNLTWDQVTKEYISLLEDVIKRV